MTTAFVGGALANRPGNGGGAAVRMDWVRGLQRLGLDVWFVEQMARENAAPPAVRFFAEVTRRHGLAGRAALLDLEGGSIAGADPAELLDAAAGATLVNLSGHLTLPPLRERFRRQVYVDLDPGYTQLWHAEGRAAARLAGHDAFYTVGLNVGTPACSIPTGDVPWRPLPPPVVLADWPVVDGGLRAFTTVAAWRGSFGRRQHGGRSFGAKAHELRKLLALPARVPAPVEIALAIHPADERDLLALREHGWRVVDPRAVAGDPASYRRYLQGSGAEVSAAQGVYVETRSGWLSDRTVRYLATGKPALVQDTGLATRYPLGEGLVAFRTLEEAVAGAERIAGDYDRHRQTARALAETYFDSDVVLGRLLAEVGVGG